MSARWVMAKAILDVGMNMGALAHLSGRSFEDKIVDFQIAALAAAGYRILAPGELDQATVERCADTLDKGIYASKHDMELAWDLAGLLRRLPAGRSSLEGQEP